MENRVTSIGTVTNGYRSDGMRAWKQVGSGSKTYFLYDGGNPIIEMNSSGTTTAINTFGPDGLVARQSGGNWTDYKPEGYRRGPAEKQVKGYADKLEEIHGVPNS